MRGILGQGHTGFPRPAARAGESWPRYLNEEPRFCEPRFFFNTTRAVNKILLPLPCRDRIAPPGLVTTRSPVRLLGASLSLNRSSPGSRPPLFDRFLHRRHVRMGSSAATGVFGHHCHYNQPQHAGFAIDTHHDPATIDIAGWGLRLPHLPGLPLTSDGHRPSHSMQPGSGACAPSWALTRPAAQSIFLLFASFRPLAPLRVKPVEPVPGISGAP